MDSLPIALVAPPGPNRDRFLANSPAGKVEVFDTPSGFLTREGEEWGVLFLGPNLPPDQILELLAAQEENSIPWIPLLVREQGRDFTSTPISLGHPLRTEQVISAAENPDDSGPILELHWVLRVISKARHDLNNPLTSGLAEAQLLLMDPHPDDVKESLETIQSQFRRLRDMVAELSSLRPPRKQSDQALY